MLPARLALLTASCVFALAIATTAIRAQQSNVLVLIADDLGIDAVNCYGLGLRTVPTPNIDALAAGGVRFTRAYMNPACSPTRSCVTTGRYGFRNGVPATVGPEFTGLDADETTLPMALRNCGYARGLVGKWHLGHAYGNSTPNVMGWPHFAGIIDAGVHDNYSWPRVVNGQVTTSTTYVTTQQVNDALSWLGARTTPWLLVVSFCAPHSPYQAPPQHLHTRNLQGLDPATNSRPFYEAMVQALDTEIGRLLAGLGPTVRANTNVLLFGDNGTDGRQAIPPFQPGRVKGSLYDAGARVPFIASGPAVVAPGRVCDGILGAVDVFATVADLCGALPTLPPSPAGAIDGVSFRPLLDNSAPAVRDYAYIDMQYSPFGGGYAIVGATHTLIRKLHNGEQRQELYHTAVDPHQTTDLLAAPLSAADSAAYLQLLVQLAALRNDGWVENIGSSCRSPALPSPGLRSQTMPRIGTFYVPQITNLGPSALGIYLAAGYHGSFALPGAFAPQPLDAFGLSNCTAYTDDSIFWVWADSPYPYGGFLALPMPFVPVLVGVEFTLQAYVAEPSANAFGMLTTNAQHGVIGL